MLTFRRLFSISCYVFFVINHGGWPTVTASLGHDEDAKTSILAVDRVKRSRGLSQMAETRRLVVAVCQKGLTRSPVFHILGPKNSKCACYAWTVMSDSVANTHSLLLPLPKRCESHTDDLLLLLTCPHTHKTRSCRDAVCAPKSSIVVVSPSSACHRQSCCRSSLVEDFNNLPCEGGVCVFIPP